MSTSRCDPEGLNDLEKQLLLAGLFWHRRQEGDAEGFVPTVLLIYLVLHWWGIPPEKIDADWEGEWDQIPASHREVFEALF